MNFARQTPGNILNKTEIWILNHLNTKPNYLVEKPWLLRSPREESGVISLSPSVSTQAGNQDDNLKETETQVKTPIPQPTKKSRRVNALNIHFPTIAKRRSDSCQLLININENLNSSNSFGTCLRNVNLNKNDSYNLLLCMLLYLITLFVALLSTLLRM